MSYVPAFITRPSGLAVPQTYTQDWTFTAPIKAVAMACAAGAIPIMQATRDPQDWSGAVDILMSGANATWDILRFPGGVQAVRFRANTFGATLASLTITTTN